ncbi:UNVERIFIED_CONTAM: hypothetical protein GTU68_064434 [Idotea baltica]|nr:hypothetical protein [Idotea baltica]
MLRFTLTRDGFHFHEAENHDEMIAQINNHRPDLILMDWMLQETSGPHLIKQLRKDPFTRDIPIIMLTAKAEEADMIQGLESGADDYISKPVSPKSLMARIKALLRRSESFSEDDIITYGPLHLNLAEQNLLIHEKSVEIGQTEFRLLRHFMLNPERVLSRSQLLDHVWGKNNFIEERTVDVHILRLRKILKKRSVDHLLKTIRGSGYKLTLQTTN